MIMICATLVNTQTDTHAHTDTQTASNRLYYYILQSWTNYSVSQKHLRHFSCNSRKHCQIFIMFGIHVPEKVSNQ